MADSAYAIKKPKIVKNKSQGVIGNKTQNLIIRKIDRAKMQKISKIIGEQQENQKKRTTCVELLNQQALLQEHGNASTTASAILINEANIEQHVED